MMTFNKISQYNILNCGDIVGDILVLFLNLSKPVCLLYLIKLNFFFINAKQEIWNIAKVIP